MTILGKTLGLAAIAFILSVGATPAADLGRGALMLRYAANLPRYERPQMRIEVSPGRFIHMICVGEGSPTVVLNAGWASWAQSWVFVQPEVAKEARVCAWDRAGNGFSSGSDEPQDVAHTERDLERALDGAGVTGPLIFAAHSMGAVEALLFADRYPGRVVGMVLVDPSWPGQYDNLHRVAPQLMALSDASDQKMLDGARACLAALDGAARAAPPLECAKLRPRYPTPLLDSLSSLTADPLYWKTYISDFSSLPQSSAEAINPRRNYGDMPLVILSAGNPEVSGAPVELLHEVSALDAEKARGYQSMAAYSSRGTITSVPNSGHAIQLEKPDVVTESIRTLIEKVRAASPKL